MRAGIYSDNEPKKKENHKQLYKTARIVHLLDDTTGL